MATLCTYLFLGTPVRSYLLPGTRWALVLLFAGALSTRAVAQTTVVPSGSDRRTVPAIALTASDRITLDGRFDE